MAKKQRTRALPRARHRPTTVAHTRPSAPPPTPAVAARPINWVRVDSLIVAGAVVLALLFYCWRLDTPSRYVFDEVYHAFTAGQLAKGNADAWLWNTTPPPDVAYEWTHPAMSKLIMETGIAIFGDDAVGWRVMSALFGALGIGLVYAMGRVLFNRQVGLLAAALLLLDGLWFVQSRIGMNDIFLTTFIMAGYLAFFLYLRGPADETRRYLWLTGLALGLALATKWSAGYSLAVVGAFVALREGRLLMTGQLKTPVWRVLLILGGALAVVPAAVYLLSYVQFFGMGHTVEQWRELQRQMWYYHTNLKAQHPWSSRWWTWPLLLKPVWYHVDVLRGDARPASIYALGNPLIFWAFLPAVGYAIYRLHEGRYRSAALAVVILGFLGQWLPWLLSPRISFLYHMLPSVPFGCLAIAYALYRVREPRAVVLGYLVPVALVFIYFFPIYSAWPISRDFLEQHYWISGWKP